MTLIQDAAQEYIDEFGEGAWWICAFDLADYNPLKDSILDEIQRKQRAGQEA